MMQKFQVWQNAWKPDMVEPVEILLPDEWDVEFHKMYR